MRMQATGMSSIATISIRLVSGVGFSNGCALLALKKPPPSPDSSLIGSHDATRPPGTCCVPPASVATRCGPLRLSITPRPARTIPKITASGSSTRVTARVRSTQQFPTRSVSRRTRPRISASAAARPTAALRKASVPRPAAWSGPPSVVSPG